MHKWQKKKTLMRKFFDTDKDFTRGLGSESGMDYFYSVDS